MSKPTSDAKPDLLGFRVAHRAMRGDARRLAVAVTEIAEGRRPCDAARAAALARFTEKLCESIHHHHTIEDEALWPVLERSAGAAVDLSDLSDDHAELDPLLAEVGRGARELTRDREAARTLAKNLTTLADLLDEHITEEERTVFPIIDRYVSVADWEQVEDRVRKGGDLRFELPRIARYASPEELAALKRLAGPVLSVLLLLVTPGDRRRQRLIFGS